MLNTNTNNSLLAGLPDISEMTSKINSTKINN